MSSRPNQHLPRCHSNENSRSDDNRPLSPRPTYILFSSTISIAENYLNPSNPDITIIQRRFKSTLEKGSMASSFKSSSSYKKYETRKRNPDPKSCALLVIDMQNHFHSMAKPIISDLSTTIRLCRQAAIPVIFTRHCHKSASDHGMLEEWWDGDLILDGTAEADLIRELDRRSDDLVVEKNTYSAFRNTVLEEKLGEMGVKEVLVTGVMTNLCCETTARDAFIRGFRVFFSTDATATSNAELHEATLKNMAYGFAYLLDCQRLQDGLFGK